MTLQILQLSRDAAPQRIAVGAERTTVIVRPGDQFRFVDESGAPQRLSGLRVRRVDNHLVIDGLGAAGREIELQNFFGACRPGAECRVSLAGLGEATGTIVTEETPPVAALSDGSFLLYSSDPTAAAAAALPAAPALDTGGGMSGGMIGAIGGGLLLAGAAGAAAGGGGGGGGGPATDTTPPAAPVITSPAVVRGVRPTITGEAEAGARVTLRIDVNGNGVFTDAADATWTTTAGADGRWQVDTATAPQFGSLPSAGLAENVAYGVLAQATDAANNVSPSTRSSLTVDASPPPAPIINVVAGDDVINAAERAAGVTVSGTAEAGSRVAVALGGVALSATAGADGTWAVTFAASQISGTGLSTVSAAAVDAAGNTGPTTTRQVVLETVVPGAPLITDNAAGTASGPVTFTITFERPVTGFTASDITVTGGTPGAFAGSGTTYTLAVTPTPNVQQGQIVLQVPAGAAIDGAGNPTAGPATAIQAYDTLRPSITVTDNVPGVAGGPVTFTFTFNEAVTGFTASDVTVTGGAPGAFAGSGTTYTLVVTPAAGTTGTITVDVPAGAASDAVGLTSTALTPSAVQAFDRVAPTLTITDTAPGTAGGPVTFTFDFGEPVADFALDDLTITGLPTGSTVGAITEIAPGRYTLVVTPAPDTSGSFGIAVRAAAAVDAAGNASPAASVTQAFNTDSSLPTLTISDATTATVTNAPVTFTFGWSEPVTGFGTPASDVVVTGGTVTTPLSGSGATYSMVVTPTPGVNGGTILVTVPAGAAADLNGNANTTGASGSQAFDTLAPVAGITDDAPGTATGPVTFTFGFGEAVTGFALDDLTVTGVPPSAVGTLTTISPSTYTLLVSPAANTTGTIGVSVRASAVADAAGNTNVAASATQAFNTDTTPPTVAISDTTGPTVTAAPVTFNFLWSEAVTGFGAQPADLTVTGGSITTPLSGSGTSYSMVVTPTPGVNGGTISVSVPAGAASDLNGNPNPASAVATQAYDTLAPVAAISDNVPGATATGPVTFTVSFGETVTGFLDDDLTVTGLAAGSTVGPVTATGTAGQFTVLVTPAASSSGTINFAVRAGAATDAAGNTNAAAAATQAYNTDSSPPTLVISDGTPATVTNAPVTFTFSWSEPVTGFVASDITLDGGTITTPLSGSGDTYTMTVTPTANASGTITVTVPAGAATDASGNPNATGASGSQPYDRVAPTVAITDNRPEAVTNQPVTFTFTTSEPVTGFDATDVSVTGGTVTTALTPAGGNVYTMTVEPTPNEASSTITVFVVAGRFADLAGNTNTASPVWTQPYDTLAPTQTVSASAVLDNVPGPGETTVAAGGSTDDTTPRLSLTLSSVLGSGESILLSRTGPGGTSLVTTFTAGSGTTPSFQETVPLTAGSYSYSATIADTAGNSLPLDLVPGGPATVYAFTVL
jgi:hypothetical protein